MKLIDSGKKTYKGNFHVHTTNSDGRLSPEAVMALYAEHGYDFLALTDHWKVGAEQRFGDMLVLPGVEYDFTFPGQVLHVVAIYPDAACGDGIVRGMTHPEVIAHINARGGLPIAAHPAWSLNTPDFLASLDGVATAEVYNTVSGFPWNSPRSDGSFILDVTASNTGKLFGWVASDDSHFYTGEACVSYSMVQADELTVPSVIEAVKAGRFYASQGPEFLDVELTDTQMIVRTSPVSTCSFVSNIPWVTGRTRSGDGITESVYDIQPKDTFIRCEIVDAQGKRAWTSPVKVN